MVELYPKEIHEKMQQEGYVYLDVRTEEEFAQGHPEGAYNVPVFLRTAQGQIPNENFADVVQKHFGQDTRLVVGCAAGGRSAHAVELLENLGYRDVINVLCGFGGHPAHGPGWLDAGLPVSGAALPGRSYGALRG